MSARILGVVAALVFLGVVVVTAYAVLAPAASLIGELR